MHANAMMEKVNRTITGKRRSCAGLLGRAANPLHAAPARRRDSIAMPSRSDVMRGTTHPTRRRSHSPSTRGAAFAGSVRKRSCAAAASTVLRSDSDVMRAEAEQTVSAFRASFRASPSQQHIQEYAKISFPKSCIGSLSKKFFPKITPSHVRLPIKIH
jgi:hypothetical protein